MPNLIISTNFQQLIKSNSVQTSFQQVITGNYSGYNFLIESNFAKILSSNGRAGVITTSFEQNISGQINQPIGSRSGLIKTLFDQQILRQSGVANPIGNSLYGPIITDFNQNISGGTIIPNLSFNIRNDFSKDYNSNIKGFKLLSRFVKILDNNPNYFPRITTTFQKKFNRIIPYTFSIKTKFNKKKSILVDNDIDSDFKSRKYLASSVKVNDFYHNKNERVTDIEIDLSFTNNNLSDYLLLVSNGSSIIPSLFELQNNLVISDLYRMELNYPTLRINSLNFLDRDSIKYPLSFEIIERATNKTVWSTKQSLLYIYKDSFYSRYSKYILELPELHRNIVSVEYNTNKNQNFVLASSFVNSKFYQIEINKDPTYNNSEVIDYIRFTYNKTYFEYLTESPVFLKEVGENYRTITYLDLGKISTDQNFQTYHKFDLIREIYTYPDTDLIGSFNNISNININKCP